MAIVKWEYDFSYKKKIRKDNLGSVISWIQVNNPGVVPVDKIISIVCVYTNGGVCEMHSVKLVGDKEIIIDNTQKDALVALL